MKKLLILAIFLSFLVTGNIYAQSSESETITTSELRIEDPGTLPSSPFYFLKEFRRTLRRFLAFNPIRKAEVVLEEANERAAEIKKLETEEPENAEAIKKALANYEKAQERFRLRLEKVRETSENPNVDRLLEALAGRVVRHEKLFDEISKKFEEKEEIKNLATRAKEKLEEAGHAGARKDDPAKFALRLEKALLETNGSDLKHLRSIVILEKLSRKAPEELSDSLERLREDFVERLKEDIESFSEEVKAEEFGKVAQDLPGDRARYAVILEELREKVESRTRGALEGIRDSVTELLEKQGDVSERAEESIKHAEELIARLEKLIAEKTEVKESVKVLLSQAKTHLERARKAFEEKKYGETFGQSRAAEVLTRNAFKMLEETSRPEKPDLARQLEELELKIKKYEELLKEKVFTPEAHPKAFELLGDAKTHLGFAREAFSKDDLAGTRLHISHVRDYLNDLARLIEVRREVKKEERKESPIVCTQEYRPVCGADGRTYPNACHARVAGVKIKHQGECERSDESTISPETSIPGEGPQLTPEERGELLRKVNVIVPREFKIEADDSGFYPSSIRVAQSEKVKILFVVRTTNVYFGGLRFTSPKFRTASVKPGGSVVVDFTADESFDFQSWWPLQDVLKATGRVSVE